MSTPHNRAKKGDFSKVCIMPGDPLRAKWIAETFLDKVKIVNDIRCMYAYTGYYKGKRVSVMAHGMGIPSIGIYSYELFKFYDVDYIIRVGSAATSIKGIRVGSVFIVKDAFSKSQYMEELGAKSKDDIYKPSKKIYDTLVKTSQQLKIPYHSGRIFSEDCFYSTFTPAQRIKLSKGCQMCEMESAALFANANKLHKQAATILTCSDSLITKDAMTHQERQSSMKNMIKIALETCIKLIK